MEEEFLQQLTIAVKSKFGEEYEVLLKKVVKNNDSKQTGVLVKKRGSFAVPIIYIDDILQQIEAGSLTIQEGIDKVFETPLESFMDVTVVETVRNLTKQDILSRVVYGVINEGYNQEYLADKPYREFLDLAVIYRVILEETEESSKSLVLTNGMCTLHGVNLAELEAAARRNTEQRGFFVERLSEVLARMTGCFVSSHEPGELWVCGMRGSASEIPYGACVLLYAGVFKNLADELASDLFILPSSIHEVLVLEAGFASDNFQGIVKEVNGSDVIEATDVLSDNVYYYNRETGKITIVQG